MRYMRWLILWMSLAFAMSSHAEEKAVQANGTLYTWATSNLNMREKPDAKSAIVARLPYATAVQVLPQDEPAVPFEMVFFKQTDAQTPKTVLHGQWLKVKTGEHEGYVFSRLLMKIPPPAKGEAPEKYLIRTFDLKLSKTDKKIEKSDQPGTDNILIRKIYTSNSNNITFTALDNKGDAGVYGNGGEVILPDMDLEQGIVFFSAVLPPVHENNSWYEEGKKLGYSLDEIGNSASLEVTQQGLTFSWFIGLN